MGHRKAENYHDIVNDLTTSYRNLGDFRQSNMMDGEIVISHFLRDSECLPIVQLRMWEILQCLKLSGKPCVIGKKHIFEFKRTNAIRLTFFSTKNVSFLFVSEIKPKALF